MTGLISGRSCCFSSIQGDQIYLPPSSRSRIEFLIPMSTVDTLSFNIQQICHGLITCYALTDQDKTCFPQLQETDPEQGDLFCSVDHNPVRISARLSDSFLASGCHRCNALKGLAVAMHIYIYMHDKIIYTIAFARSKN